MYLVFLFLIIVVPCEFLINFRDYSTVEILKLAALLLLLVWSTKYSYKEYKSAV
jgi:hypothetical protein